MKNSAIVLLLVTGLVSAQFSQYFVAAGFNLNRSYIAQNLCINKSRPWLHCNGRCYLMRKLKQAADKEAAGAKDDQKNIFQPAIFTGLSLIKFAAQTGTCFLIAEPRFLLPKADPSIFQPPRA